MTRHSTMITSPRTIVLIFLIISVLVQRSEPRSCSEANVLFMLNLDYRPRTLLTTCSQAKMPLNLSDNRIQVRVMMSDITFISLEQLHVGTYRHLAHHDIDLS